MKRYNKTLIISFAVLCGAVWGLAEIKIGIEIGCCYLYVHREAGIIANAFAITVTVLSILSLSKELQKDLETVKKVEKEVKKLRIHLNPPSDVFIDSNNKEFVETVTKCLKEVKIDSDFIDIDNDLKPDQFFETLQEKLEYSKIVIVPYCISASWFKVDWFQERKRLYRKQKILNKIIVCTDKEDEVRKLFRDMKSDVVTCPMTEQLSCKKFQYVVKKALLNKHDFS